MAQIGRLTAVFDVNARGFSAGVQKMERMTDSLSTRIRGMKPVIMGFAAGIAAAGTALVFAGNKFTKVAIEIDALNRKLNLVAGEGEGAAKTFSFIANESNRLGVSLKDSLHTFTSMQAAARGTSLTGEDLQEVFSGVAESASVMGLSGANTKLVFLALEQMLNKSTVQAEELKRQMGDRLPEAIGIMARGLGITTAELMKMMEQGLLISEEVLPLMARQMKLENAPAIESLGESLQVAVTRMKNAWFFLEKALAESELTDVIKTIVNDVTKELMDLAEHPEKLIEGLRIWTDAFMHLYDVAVPILKVLTFLLDEILRVVSSVGVVFNSLSMIVEGAFSAVMSMEPTSSSNLMGGMTESSKALDEALRNTGEISGAVAEAVVANEELKQAAFKETASLAGAGAPIQGEAPFDAAGAIAKEFTNKFETMRADIGTDVGKIGLEGFDLERFKIQDQLDKRIVAIDSYVAKRSITLQNSNEKMLEMENQQAALILEATEAANSKLLDVTRRQDEELAEIAGAAGQERLEAVTSLLENTLGTATRTFAEWATGMGGSFDGLIQSFLVDLTELMTQLLVVKPLLDAFKNAFSGVDDGGGLLGSLFGGGLSGLLSFANGGIINEPVFGVGTKSGSNYMIGESGPEAIVPLNKKGSSQAAGGASTNNVNISISAVDSKSLVTLMRNNPEAVTAPIMDALSVGNRGLTAAFRGAV